MARVAVLCALVVVCCVGVSICAPLEDFAGGHGKQELADRFVEFLKQDSQLSSALSKFSSDQGLIRNRRANAMDDVESIDTTTLQTANTEGFFDRAAKFVMEVLQRFLRWVNTDD